MWANSRQKERYENINAIFHNAELEIQEMFCENCDEPTFYEDDTGAKYCAEEIGQCPYDYEREQIHEHCKSFANIMKEFF